MKMVVLHQVVPGATPDQPEKQIAVNEDEVLRMLEVDGGTEIIQGDKGPTLVKETLEEVMKEMGQKMPEKKPAQQPQQAQAHGAAAETQQKSRVGSR